jgi:DNA-directed RNA polymerase subunit K/omega
MIFTIEKIWEKYDNKYKAINIAALESRKLKDHQVKGLVDQNMNLIIESLRKLMSGKIRYKE